MRERTIKIVRKHLKRLKGERLEEFKKTFCKMKAPRGREKIQPRHLKDKPAEETAEVIIDCYTVRNASGLITAALRKIKCNQIRIELQRDLRKGKKENQKRRRRRRQSAGQTLVIPHEQRPILEPGGSTRPNYKALENEVAKDGISTSTQNLGEEKTEDTNPSSGQEWVHHDVTKLNDDQDEGNNDILRFKLEETEVYIPVSEATQVGNRALMSLSHQDVASLEERRNVIKHTVLTPNIKKEEEELFPDQQPSNCKASWQTQNPGPGDANDDVSGGEQMEDQLENKVPGPKPAKEPAQNGIKRPKQKSKQKKNAVARPKLTRQQAKNDGKHFVDIYRADLIDKVTTIDPVLDVLLDKVILTTEPYDIVMKQKTTQGKMRALYTYVRSWGIAEKNTFLKLLSKHNPPVIKNLKKQSMKK
ncbi:uncharacterized protein [Hyperolius riggenbachi]|uniref:uncharacterized protein n=1 Tax=Hyperolius riggenbachi TaxID=752182 RepID=UPI0035A268D3